MKTIYVVISQRQIDESEFYDVDAHMAFIDRNKALNYIDERITELEKNDPDICSTMNMFVEEVTLNEES